MDGSIERDLRKIEDELPLPEQPRPVQCRSYDCDWIGTTDQLAAKNRKGPFRKTGKGNEMAQITVESLNCPKCGRWNRDG